jgi:hypothetical protein
VVAPEETVRRCALKLIVAHAPEMSVVVLCHGALQVAAHVRLCIPGSAVSLWFGDVLVFYSGAGCISGLMEGGVCMPRWAVEQLSGVIRMAKGKSGTSSSLLCFLALHAFFAVDPSAASPARISHTDIVEPLHHAAWVHNTSCAASPETVACTPRGTELG